MKRIPVLLLFLLLPFFLIPEQARVSPYTPRSATTSTPAVKLTDELDNPAPTASSAIEGQAPLLSTKNTPAPQPDPFPNLYGCEMEMTFTSGPLETRNAEFTVLGLDYFSDKGEKFYPGEKTAVYYALPRYIILHSAFYNGNISRPLEAEFIRYYLEYWGGSGAAYIQEQMDALTGSEVEWTCNGDLILTTHVREIIRLSQEASDQLWLEPMNLEQILIKREGLVSEWIGDMTITDEPTLYLGFCGWGPEASGDERYYYYRYLINFDLDATD